MDSTKHSTNKTTEKEVLNRTCMICHKVYSGRSQLFRHLRETHNELDKSYAVLSDKSRYIFKCLEGCDHSFRISRDLREHLNLHHGFSIQEKVRQFNCIEDFNKWFGELQESGNGYVKNTLPRKGNNSATIAYYLCNRTGTEKLKTVGRVRKLKEQGSRKMNAGCTCYLKVVELDGKCTVTYCDFHYGHKIELQHIPIPYRTRAEIVNQLKEGAQLVRIKIPTGGVLGLNKVQRSRILTRRDLKNLEYYLKRETNLPASKLLKSISGSTLTASSTSENVVPEEVITIISDDQDMTEDTHIEQTAVFCKVEMEAEEFLSEEIEVPFYEGLPQANNVEEENENDSFEAVSQDEIETDDRQDEFSEPSDDNDDEETYGRYVAQVLSEIEPCERERAKRRIDKILKYYLSKSSKALS